MNQNHVDDRDVELEALLRATFSSEAQNRVPESRPVPPFPATERIATVHPIRRRWVGLSVVAAALVAVVVGATVLATETMDSQRRPDIPAGTSVAPAPTPSVSALTVGPTPPASTAASSPPAAVTKQVTVLGVGLTVPVSWNVVTRPVGDSGGTPSVCLTTDTEIRSTGFGTYNCQLSVSVGASLWGSQDVDRVGFSPDGGICGTDRQQPHETDTVAADEVVVDGQTAEHRAFTGSCLDQVLDQWTVPTAPFVQFWRDFGPADAAGAAQALAAVRSATLPGPRSALRLTDHGYLTAVSGDTVSLDRITDLNQLGVENNNPATYDYPVGASATIDYSGGAGGAVTLTIDQLRALAAGRPVEGVPALDTLQATLITDGTQVTRVDLYDRT